MLSGRYIHLHQALGLGPLWLNRAAQVHGQRKAAPARPAAPPPASHRNQEEVQAMIAQLAVETTTHTPPPAPADAAAAHIALRMVYTVSESATGVTVWLTLRPNLNTDAADINNGDFGKLLQQLIRSSGHLPTAWQSLPERESDITAACLHRVREHRAQRLVFLGEDIDPALKLSTRLDVGVRTLTLPHPVRLLRQSPLKKAVWKRIRHFFFEQNP